MAIPKILHFTWKSRDLPRFFAEIMDRWRGTHPDWDIRFYDDADIRAVVADYPGHLERFDAYPSGIYRSDAFRYFVLHRDGGVYADLDVVPLQNIDALVGGLRCFVAVTPEPDSQVSDQLYGGMPYSLCNAFMGSEPGHPFWSFCIDRLAVTENTDVLDATGPRFLHAAGLTVDSADRPTAILPDAWSPLSGTGRPAPMSVEFAERVARQFEVAPNGRGAVVSHLWRNSWSMPFPYKGVQFWRWPNRLQWAWRRMRSPRIAKLTFTPPAITYDDQSPKFPSPLPTVAVGISCRDDTQAEGLAALLASLTYPRDRLVFGLCGPRAKAVAAALDGKFDVVEQDDNSVAALLKWGAGRGQHVFLLDGGIADMPVGTIEMLLASGRPVAGGLAMWADALAESFLYYGPMFKFMYRNGGRTGVVHTGAVGRERQSALSHRVLRYAPATSVSLCCTLVASEVVNAGILPDEDYKAHGGAAGFCIKARDNGFEVCVVPDVVAHRRA